MQVMKDRKHFANCVKDRPNVEKVEQKIINIDDNRFKGDIYLNNFIKIKDPRILDNGVCIQNNNYKWLEFYDYNSKIRLTAMYDENNEIIEWYFDMARSIGKENGIPYEEDLYLDVVLTPKGNIIMLDENELKEAYERNELTHKELEETYSIANDLIQKINGKSKELKEFTDKYFKLIMGDD